MISLLPALILLALGVFIIGAYWVYYLRVLAAKLGYGQVRYSSFTPLVGPVCITLSCQLYRPEWVPTVAVWAFLLDLNTYVLMLSLPFLFREIVSSLRNDRNS